MYSYLYVDRDGKITFDIFCDSTCFDNKPNKEITFEVENEEKQEMTKFKVGDAVYCTHYEQSGVVAKIADCRDYPVVVVFDDKEGHYTMDGRLFICDQEPCLSINKKGRQYADVDRLTALEQQMQHILKQNEQLKQELEVLKEKDNTSVAVEEVKPSYKRWRAEEREEYFYLDSFGYLELTKEELTEVDDYLYISGNYFQTKEMAESYKEKLLATQRIKDKIAELNAEQGWELDWSSNEGKYSIIFSHEEGVFGCDYCIKIQLCDKSLVGSKEAIQWVIDNMQDDLKLMYDIKD